jgi:hypothetical protein
VVRREIQRRHSLTIAKRMMTELLGREITSEEAEAVASVWRQEVRAGLGPRAHRMFRETYARFRDADANRMHRWSARFATARRWTLAAAVLARRGQFVEAFRYLGYGLRWHPLGVMASVSYLAHRVTSYLRNAEVRDELIFSWTEQAKSVGASV